MSCVLQLGGFFFCEDGDIAFSIVHKKGDIVKEIYPRQRVDCQKSIEEGELCCMDIGTCKLQLEKRFFRLSERIATPVNPLPT